MTDTRERVMSKYFFTADGTFGSACAGDFEVIDTTHWTDKDWELIELAGDNDRLDLARELIK
jgi:hypothetical protein